MVGPGAGEELGDARRAVRVRGEDRDLPSLPGARRDAESLQRDRNEAARHLFARRNDGIIFTRVGQVASSGLDHTVDHHPRRITAEVDRKLRRRRVGPVLCV